MGLLIQSATTNSNGQKNTNSADNQKTPNANGTTVSATATNVVVTAKRAMRAVNTNFTFDFPYSLGYGLSFNHLKNLSRLLEFC